jgi:ComEC/Rec2-related protein
MTSSAYLRLITLGVFTGGLTEGCLHQSGLVWPVSLLLLVVFFAGLLPRLWPQRIRASRTGTALLAIGLALTIAWVSFDRIEEEKVDPQGYVWLVKSFVGRVRQQRLRNHRVRLIIGTEQAVLIDGRTIPLAGDVVVFASAEMASNISPNSLVSVVGDLAPLPAGGSFASFWNYLTERDVRALVFKPESINLLAQPEAWRRILSRIRQACDAWFDSLGTKGRVFMQALVFGDRSGLGVESKQDFVDAGIIHVMAVSGLHIAVASAVFFWIFSLFGAGKRFAWPLVMALLVVYAGLCGWTPSVMRAVCTLILVSVFALIRSSVAPLDILLLVGMMLYLEDRSVINQPGFLLSFSATAGIMLFASPLTDFLRWLRIPRWLASTLAVSFAAQLAVLPILSVYFGRVSIISPLANCIFVPLILGLQATGIVLPVLSLFGAAALAEAIFGTMLDLLYSAIHQVASLPWAALEIGELHWWGVLAYTCLVIVSIKGSQRVILGRRKNRRLALTAQVASLLASTGDDGQARTRPELPCQPSYSRTDHHLGRDRSRRGCA